MPKIVDHEKYRDELAFRSFDIVAREGIDSLSIRALAKKLGVSTGVLYHYFSSKEDLFKYVSQAMTQKTVTVISENFTEKTSLEGRLRIIHNLVEENLPHYQNLLMLSIDFLRYSKESKETLKIMKDSSKNHRKGIIDYLELSPEYGAFVHIFICGLIYQKLIFPEASSFEKQAKIFREMFLPYFKKAKK